MQFRIGDATFDVTTRALYLASISTADDVASKAADATEAGADGVIVHGPADSLAVAVDAAREQGMAIVGARAVQSASKAQRSAVITPGAALVFVDAEDVSPAVLAELAAAEVAVAVGPASGQLEYPELASVAQTQGLTLDRLAVALDSAERVAITQASAAGLKVLVAPGAGPGRMGSHVAAMMAGARIVESQHVSEARRIGYTVTELLARRSLG